MRHGGNGAASKRVGRWYLLLVVLGTTGALALAWRFDLNVATTAATLLPTVAPLFLAWKTFRHDRIEAAGVDLDTAAAQLAVAVRKQWNDEANVRRMNDPYPLPVAWKAADPDLVESWPLLESMARAWPGGPPGDPGQWPADSTGLAGADAQIEEVFTKRVPTRRLVVLGEPGAGKTMLLIRLLQHLNEPHVPGNPVPVLFALASWNPADQTLNEWLAGQLRQSYPGLRAPAPGGQGDLAQALLDAGRILPLLDGFDELPPALHDMGFNALNRDLAAKAPLVLASRVAAYRDTVARPEAMVRLNGAAGIHLLPLARQDAEAYLRRDAGGPDTPAAHRWDAVAAQLGTDTPLGQTLSTPLGLFLARTIYNPRPDTTPAPGGIPHPDELCAFPGRDALNAHLFNAFIPAAYAPHHSNSPRWNADQAHRAHVFLARHLENNRRGSPDLAWWELPLAIRRTTLRITIGLAAGLTFGLAAGLPHGPAGLLAVGLPFGLAFGLAHLSAPDSGAPGIRHRWSTGSLAVRVAYGLVNLVVITVVFGLADELTDEPADFRAVGFGVGLVVGFPFGLARLSAPDSGTPSVRLRWSPRSFTAGLGFGLGAGLLAGLTQGLGDARDLGLAGALADGLSVGLLLGLVGGLVAGLAAGFRTVRPEVTAMVGPAELHTRDRRTFIAIVSVIGTVVGLAGGLLVGITSNEPVGMLVFGLLAGLSAGLAFGLAHTAHAGFTVTTFLLAIRRRVPRDLMAFLQDAHMNRGVLRQVGAVYQFRHLDLQRHLAHTAEPRAAQPEPTPSSH